VTFLEVSNTLEFSASTSVCNGDILYPNFYNIIVMFFCPVEFIVSQ